MPIDVLRLLRCSAVLGLFSLCAIYSHAQAPHADACGGPWLRAIDNFLGWQLPKEAVVAEVCKPWPGSRSVVLTAVAYTPRQSPAQPSATPRDEPGDKKNLLVAMVDTRSGHVLASHRQTVSEDATVAVDSHSLSLDTARYRLSGKVRAFGLRFNSSAMGASCPEAGWGDELTLFVPKGEVLEPVLHLAMLRQRAVTACISAQAEGALWEVADLTLAVLPSQTNGLADLRVTATIRRETSDDRVPPAAVTTEHAVLRHGPAGYRASGPHPWWLGSR